eukprot:14937183-Alexandrium_andersonii.AAC.1
MVTFDGGARLVGEGRVAGAGAALWSRPDEVGVRVLMGCATVALPAVPHAQEAEAWGARLALLLLLRAPAPLVEDGALVVGDNLGV